MVIPKHMRKCSTLINCESWRLQPVLFEIGQKKLLIINSYFPTDPKTINSENQELMATLAITTNILDTTTFNSVYLAGDLNASVLRNTSHVQEIFFQDIICSSYGIIMRLISLTLLKGKVVKFSTTL